MPIAYIQEFPANGDTTTTNYDAVKERLNVEADRPDGMIIHTAGFTAEGVFRIFDVWDSEEQHARFMSERLMPIVEDWDLPRLIINIAYPNRQYVPTKVRVFIDFLVEHFQDMDFERRWTTRWP